MYARRRVIAFHDGIDGPEENLSRFVVARQNNHPANRSAHFQLVTVTFAYTFGADAASSTELIFRDRPTL